MNYHTKRIRVTCPAFLCVSTGQNCFNTQQRSVSWLLWQAKIQTKMTLPKKKLCWGSAQAKPFLHSMHTAPAIRTVCQEKQGNTPNTPGINFFNPISPTSYPPTRKSAHAGMCVYTLAGEGVRTFSWTSDLFQCTYHQATALLQLTLYRAVEAEAQSPPFSLRQGPFSPVKGRWIFPTTDSWAGWRRLGCQAPAQSARLPMALQG